ncbi:hypothetical protein [Alcaligenes sp. Marseille-Q7550]
MDFGGLFLTLQVLIVAGVASWCLLTLGVFVLLRGRVSRGRRLAWTLLFFSLPVLWLAFHMLWAYVLLVLEWRY